MALVSRIHDVIYESHRVLLPIEGYQNVPLMPLEKAVEPLFSLFDRGNLLTKVQVAKERCEKPADGLSQDESASIMLYTFQWDTDVHSLYFLLNQTLRKEDRHLLKPWFPYLKLFISALVRLPPIVDVVYRGVKADLGDEYKTNSTSTWWGISSCTDSVHVLESDQYCGTTGQRTIFVIKCFNGRSIRNHSYYEHENEILLMPGLYFRVHDRYDTPDGLHFVQLHEMKPPHAHLLLPNSISWRRIVPGICLEGTCINQECVAYRQEVIIPIGFKKFDVLTDANASTMQCPMCRNYVEISKLAFSNCHWRWNGTKQTASSKVPTSESEDWTPASDYSLFKYDIQGAIAWRQLTVEARP